MGRTSKILALAPNLSVVERDLEPFLQRAHARHTQDSAFNIRWLTALEFGDVLCNLSQRRVDLTFARKMKITTSRFIRASPDELWPLLTDSRMDVPGWFCLGVPQPRSCELPNTLGGVGSERKCISDRGTVNQRITEWSEPFRLSFEMVSTDHSWGASVDSLKEEFVLRPEAEGTRISRTTSIRAKGRFPLLKEFGFYSGLKRVHIYVFTNWKKLAGQGRGAHQSTVE